MAIFIFDGTQNVVANDFDPETDIILFDNLTADDIAAVEDTPQGGRITASSGFSLIVPSFTLSELGGEDGTPATFFPAIVAIGTDDDDVGSGSVGNGSSTIGQYALGLEDDDSVFGGNANDFLFGNEGDDTIIGNGGSDQIFGGRGDDTISVVDGDAEEDAVTVIYGGLGSDAISGTSFEGTYVVYGGNGSADADDDGDSMGISLDDGSLLVYGNAGDDSISISGTGTASIYGGMGHDAIGVGGLESVVAVGGKDGDSISVSAEDVTVYGGTGGADTTDKGDSIGVSADTAVVYGNAGDDTMSVSVTESAWVHGGSDDDSIGVAGPNATVFGGTGEDTVSITVIETGVVYGGSGSTDTADGDDILTVTVADEDGTAVVYGNGGNDGISVTMTQAADDGGITVYGGAGDDEIGVNGNGGVMVVGGIGEDLVTVFADGSNTVNGGDADDTVTISGGGDNTVTGDAGDDSISILGNGDNEVSGGAGEDTLHVGGTGVNALTGGADGDAFEFATLASHTAATSGDDVNSITDLDFDSDTIAFEDLGTPVDDAYDLTDLGNADSISLAAALAGATDLGDAADKALDWAIDDNAGDAIDENVALVFTYDGDDYLVVGQVDHVLTTQGDVEGIVKITGWTGDIDESSFVAY